MKGAAMVNLSNNLSFNGTVTNAKGQNVRTTTLEEDQKTVNSWETYLTNKADYSRIIFPDKFNVQRSEDGKTYKAQRPFGDTLIISDKNDGVEMTVITKKGLSREKLTISAEDLEANSTLNKQVTTLLAKLKDKVENALFFHFYN